MAFFCVTESLASCKISNVLNVLKAINRFSYLLVIFFAKDDLQSNAESLLTNIVFQCIPNCYPFYIMQA